MYILYLIGMMLCCSKCLVIALTGPFTHSYTSNESYIWQVCSLFFSLVEIYSHLSEDYLKLYGLLMSKSADMFLSVQLH